MIAVTGKKLEKDNKFSDAAKYYLAGIQFGQDYGMKDPFLSQAIGQGIIQRNIQCLRNLISGHQLNEKVYLPVIKELDRLDKGQVSFERLLEKDRRNRYIYGYQDYIHPLKYAKNNFLKNKSYNYKNLIVDIPYVGYMIFNGGRVSRNDINFFNEIFDVATTKTYHEFMKIDWEKKVPKDWPHRFMKAKNFTDIYTRQVIISSLLRLIEIQCAIQLYHLKNHNWPSSLKDLEPNYIAKVPLDPFTDQPFMWGRDSTGPFAYSTGPDFKDDKAQILYDPTNGTISTGDIR